MRQLVPAVVMLAALTACMPDSQTAAAERRAEAARADSSAAGYDVKATATPIAAHGPPPDSAADSTKRRGTTTVGAGGTSTTSSPVAVVTPPVPAQAPVTPRPGRQTAAPTDSSGGRRGGARAGGSTLPGLPPLDPALEGNYLAVDSGKKIATFQLAAGNELEGQVSFNGARRGGRTLTVPVGWRVTIDFTNRDVELPHSAAIVAGFEPLPEQLPPPAFPQAQTVKIEEGLLEGDSDEITFVADRAGRYLIACGVQGHAQRGQWIVLEVSPIAKVPTYR